MTLAHSFEPTREMREKVCGSMKRWLAGEPVPSWQAIIDSWGDGFCNYFHRRIGDYRDTNIFERVNNASELWGLRNEWIQEFGFMIPCAELLDACAKFQPIVEVGAGTGFMTKLMRNAGIDVIGSDLVARGQSSYAFKVGVFDDQQITASADAMVKREQARTVFCSWPSYADTWFRQALKAMSAGQHLVVIRESATAEKTAWDYLEKHFNHIETINLPNWDGMHDRGEVWIKHSSHKSGRAK